MVDWYWLIVAYVAGLLTIPAFRLADDLEFHILETFIRWLKSKD